MERFIRGHPYEATSGLDNETAYQVMNSLININNQTLIVISHSPELQPMIPIVIDFASNGGVGHSAIGSVICQS